jgi:hypothetical protein
MEKGAVALMKKTVILGDIQTIYEGTPEEIATLERLENEKEQKNLFYRSNVQVDINGEDIKEKVLKELDNKFNDISKTVSTTCQ